MKAAEFTALCLREWDEHHGDVHALFLAPESLRELAEDVIADGSGDFAQHVLRIEAGAEADAVAAGALLTEVQNPVTRSVVKLSSGGGPADLYTVTRCI